MQTFSKLSLIAMIGVSVFLSGQANAYCAKCVKIESERAKELAEKGPQPDRYYDDYISLTTPQDHSTSTKAASKDPSENLDGATYSTTQLNKQNQINSDTDSSLRVGTDNSNGVSNNEEDSNQGLGSSIDRSIKSYGTSAQDNLQERSATIRDNLQERGANARHQFEEKYYSLQDKYAPGQSSTQIETRRQDLNNHTYSTAFLVLQSKDLLKTLSGPFTLFVPSNEALRQLPPGMVQDLLRPENQEKLAHLVANHLVASKLNSQDMTSNQIQTLSGKNLNIRTNQNGVTTINEAKVIRTEDVGSNGVIYVIDRVLLP